MTEEWKKLELDMMRTRAVQAPLCIKHLRKIATGNGNFEYYYDTKGYYVWSVAKPGSGCDNTVFGKRNYFIRKLIDGIIPYGNLTKYGRHLLRTKDNYDRIRKYV